MQLLLLSEGPNDIGLAHETTEERLGAVRVLVRRTLEKSWNRSISDHEIEVLPLSRLHTGGFARKAKMAIAEAKLRDCSCIAIVIDRDRSPHNVRLAELQKGVAEAAAAGEPLANRVAVGIAIETAEAWLLADEVALNAALVPNPRCETLPEPEKFDGGHGHHEHPKTVFTQIVRSSSVPLVSAYDCVAENVRLDVLEKRCAGGFAPFAHELRTKCC